MEYIRIGVIANTHGLRGTLKVKSFTDFKKERYKKGNTLYIHFKNDYIPVTVDSFKTVKTVEHVDFLEFKNINEVEKYKGSELFITSDMIHDLPEDEFYYKELIGMKVYTDELIGEVYDIREYPQSEYIVVKRPKQKNVVIPFMKKFIKEVDKEKGIIYINEMEGLL